MDSGNIYLDRQEAISMLKELVSNNLVDPTYVQISQRSPNHFQIQIKCDYNKAIKEHAEKHGLTIEEDKERKYLVIYKP